MKNSFPLLALALICLFFLATPVLGLAQLSGGNLPGNSSNPGPGDSSNSSTGASGGIQIPNFLGANNFQDLLVKILNALWVLAALITMLMVLISGFQFLLASGNPEKIEKAKRTLLYVVIGFVIIILSYSASAIIKSVTDTLTAGTTTGQ